MKLTESQLRKIIREELKAVREVDAPMEEAIENKDLFSDEELVPLFGTYAPEDVTKRTAFFRRVREIIGPRSLDDIKDKIFYIANQAK